jgi:uncharacterized protein YdbL (DUF1318 family)
MMNKFIWRTVFAAALIVFAGAACSVASADEKVGSGTVRELCSKANAAEEARYQHVANAWRQTVKELGALNRLKLVAADAAGIWEKMGQGADFIGSPGGRNDRMRDSLRRHVVDERTLAKALADEFVAYQSLLNKETIELLVKCGIDREAVAKAIPLRQFQALPLERAFDGVVRKAHSLASQDWFRFGLVNVGSELAANGIEQIGRSRGVFNLEEGSFGDFLTGLVTQVAVGAIADQLTDPTDKFVKELQTTMVAAEQDLLDSPFGLLTALRSMSNHHQQTRMKLLGLSVNGGK